MGSNSASSGWQAFAAYRLVSFSADGALNNETKQVLIHRRFRGPDQSANGGYCSGLVAGAFGYLPDQAVEVTLKAPPPLDKELQLQRNGESALLLDGTQVVAEGKLVAMPTLELPCSCGTAAAERAAANFVGHQHHPYPGCFVCGPQRSVGDGLRVFAGTVEGKETYASPWRPDASLADEHGKVAPIMVWAALDCPSYFALGRPGLLALLGRMTAQVRSLPSVDEDCVLMASAIGSDGRKHRSASALYGDDGRLLAHALTIWIELKMPLAG